MPPHLLDSSTYPILEITHPTATARIALNGAHVMEWTPAGEAPVLYMSPDALLEHGKPIRGGIPICWPWFGGHPTDSDKPAHGFVRTMLWTLGEITETPTGVTVLLHLSETEESLKLWPHKFELTLEVKIGAELSVALHIKNTCTEAWSMTGALHTYLCVGDIRETTVEGLENTFYVESRLSPERIQQNGSILFDREVDRNYDSPDTVSLLDKKAARSILVEKSGSHATIVWNPWIEKSKRLSDLPDEAYFNFICIEAANAVPDVIPMHPGKQHTLSQKLTVQHS